MKFKTLVPYLAFILLMLLIMIGGPRLSAYLTKNYKEKIDEHADTCKAYVYLKKTHKGNTVHFRYYYRNRPYKNDEQNDEWFDRLRIGDSITIKLDSTDPGSSYIID